ncbi:MAG: hypothetical protein AYL33_008140 [Candidatus Bathyarchaeota archaeon B63]|nr:MAG: hypothetical protein AYL33_008140 [Candidatus Bathyarchaeota archaeon B63]
MENSSKKVRRTPLFLVAVLTILVVLSIFTAIQIVRRYQETEKIDILALTLSASAVAFSIYMLLQMRREPFKLGFEPQKVSTVIRCSRCEYEATREFKEGDYVMKEEEACPKCEGPTFIYMIFREAEEKKK